MIPERNPIVKHLPTLLLLAVLAVPSYAGPAAREVVVRGAGNLEEILVAATLDAWRDPQAPRPVAVVVDVTPYTQARGGSSSSGR